MIRSISQIYRFTVHLWFTLAPPEDVTGHDVDLRQPKTVQWYTRP